MSKVNFEPPRLFKLKAEDLHDKEKVDLEMIVIEGVQASQLHGGRSY